MSNPNFVNNLIDSVLVVKASENVDSDALQDLNAPEGASIADLFNDKKITQEKDNTTQEKDQ
jgi:hypothetical protein